MKVWQYTFLRPSGIGGVEKHIGGVSAALQRMGHHVHIGTDTPEISKDEPLIVHTHGDAWPSLKLLAKIRMHPKSRWIHVCHGTSVGRVIACGEFFSPSGWKGSLRDFSVIHFANAIVTVNTQTLREARKYLRFKGPAAVIANGADSSLFKPLVKLVCDPKVIFLGRAADTVKNVDRLLEAGKLLRQRFAGFELWMAPGLEGSRAKPDFVRELGALHGEALASAMSQCRALVLCSLYEGDPLVLHEARAMGLPVAVSNLPQLREALRGYEASEFLDPTDPASIASALGNLLEPNRNVVPSPRGRTWDDVAREFSDFYTKVFVPGS